METMAVRVSDQEANAERSASEPVVFHFVDLGNGQICGGIFKKCFASPPWSVF